MGCLGSKATKLEDFVATVEDDRMDVLCSEHPTWRVFSDDIEWSTLRIKVSTEPLGIGRRPESAIVVTNKTTSGNHAEITYDENQLRWKVKDLGSSTGTIVFVGKEAQTLTTEQECYLNACCAIRLGKALVTLISESVLQQLVLHCTSGPLKDSFWKVPPNGPLACGRSRDGAIHLPTLGLHPVEFVVTRHEGWFTIEDRVVRKKTKAGRSKTGVYLNGKQIKHGELHFLWMGAEITLRKETKDKKVNVVSTFIVRCRV